MASAPQPLESDPQVDFYVLLGVSLFCRACFVVRSNPEAKSRRIFSRKQAAVAEIAKLYVPDRSEFGIHIDRNIPVLLRRRRFHLV